VAEAARDIEGDREQAPGGSGNRIDVPDAAASGRQCGLAIPADRQPCHAVERTLAIEVIGQLDDRLFTLTDRAGCHGGGGLEYVLPGARDVFAADEDRCSG